jgi:hypothetical protein
MAREGTTIPSDAKGMLGSTKTPGKFADTVSIREMHALRSRLGDSLAKLKATPGTSGDLIANTTKLRAALLDDMGAGANIADEAGQAVADALAYSRAYHKTYTEGPIGRLFESQRTGAERVMPSETVDKAVGRGAGSGERAARLDQAIEFPFSNELLDRYPDLRAELTTNPGRYDDAVESWLTDTFARQAMRAIRNC